MRKAFVLLLVFIVPNLLMAQGTAALQYAAGGIRDYVDVVKALCYSLAGIVSIGGAYSCYFAWHQGREVQKRVMMTVGSAICFVAMANVLPSFFVQGGSSYSGSFSIDEQYRVTGVDTKGFLISNNGGVPLSGIIVEIPEMSSYQWVNLPSSVSGYTSDQIRHAAEIYAQSNTLQEAEQTLIGEGYRAIYAYQLISRINSANNYQKQ